MGEASFGKSVVVESGDVDHYDVNIAGSFEFEGGVEPSRFTACEVPHAGAKVRRAPVRDDQMLEGWMGAAGAERCCGMLVQ